MLNEFKVKDFKCYVDENYFNFSGLTILCGTNNSGKSSLLQSIYLLSQNINTEIPSLPLNNINFKLGTCSDILFKEKTNKDTIEFGIVFNKSILNKEQIERLYVNFIFKNPAELEKLFLLDGDPILTAMEVEFQKKGDNIKNLDINLIDRADNSLYQIDGDMEKGYISMDGLVPSPIIYSDIDRHESRIASRDYELIGKYLRLINRKNVHYLKAYRVDDYRQSFTSGKNILGISGEYTAEFIGNKWNSHTGYYDEQNKPVKFSTKFEEWTKRLLGKQYRLKPEKEFNGYKIIIEEVNNKLKLELHQVGFGISQILPILALLLTAKENDVILIENPEIHLHPKLQAELVDLFIFALEANRKLIIETHSEHIVNRIRLRIKENNRLREKINIYFFEKDDICKYQEIAVDNNGNIDYWPKDFFDQAYYDLSGLIKK